MNWFKRLFGIKEVSTNLEQVDVKVKERVAPVGPTDQIKRKSVRVKNKTTRTERFSSAIQSRSSAMTPVYVDANKNDDSFLESMLIAEITDSAAIGTLIGGNVTGAIIGDMLNDSDSDNRDSFDNSSSNYDDSSNDSSDWSSSSDSSSYDSGSSYDSDSSSSYDSSSNDW